MINGAMAFGVPGLLTGLEVGKAIGFQSSVLAFMVGGMILTILGFYTGIVGQQNRLTSCMTITFVFGKWGAYIINLGFALSLLGWYGLNMDLFSDVLLDISNNLTGTSPNITLVEVICGVIVALMTIWGFKFIDKLSSAIVPIMALVVFYMIFQSLGMANSPLPEMTNTLSFGEAVSVVVGSFIVGVVLMPDFTRFAHTQKDIYPASILPFLILTSFVYIAAAYAGSRTGETEALPLLLALGLGWSAFALLIFSTVATMVVNLYSSSLGLNAVFQNLKEWQLTIGAGILATIAASLNILDQFTDFLFGLSIIFTPVAGVYLVDFFYLRKKEIYDPNVKTPVSQINWRAFLSWIIGVGGTFFIQDYNLKLTSLEAVDALLISMLVYYAVSLFHLRSQPR